MSTHHKYPEEYKQDRWEKEFIKIRKKVKELDRTYQKQKRLDDIGTKPTKNGGKI